MKLGTLLCVFLPILSLFSEPIRIDTLTLDPNPDSIPMSVPETLIPDRSTLILATDLRGSFSSKESALVFESNLNLQEMEAFYKQAFQKGEWKILQSQKQNDRYFVHAEGFARRTISVTVLKGKNQTFSRIFLFLKRNSSF